MIVMINNNIDQNDNDNDSDNANDLTQTLKKNMYHGCLNNL